MAPIDEALEFLESLESGGKIDYQKVANEFGVNRTTLSRRHRGVTGSAQHKNTTQSALNPQQEVELVKYIKQLTERNLEPSRQMVKNFASKLARKDVSYSWVTRFYARQQKDLTSRWSSAMDAVRHKADNSERYSRYFDYLYAKMKEYNVLPEQVYNMDEKGFAIGQLNKSKRVFSKRHYESGRSRSHTQDGNREWVTILAAICADGSYLPPSIIYAGKTNHIQGRWVDAIEPGKHVVHFTSTPSGWTNDDVGVAWLEQVFNRYTKQKARRAWRFLIIDGHGSHISKDFLDYCDKNRILVMIFPPHSTHRLQPLDVVCFSPLSA